MELPDLVNRIEEDEDLWLFVYLLIKVFEDGSDDILMHVALIRCHLVVIFNSLEGDLFSSFVFALDNFVDVELNHLFCMLFVEGCELLLHSGRAGNDARSTGLSDL